MFGFFLSFLFIKGVILGLIAWTCNVGAALLTCLIIGTILEGIASILLGENDDDSILILKEIMYYVGLLLQLVAIFVVTVPMFSLPKKEINFMMAIAVGWIGIIAAVGWFAGAMEGVTLFAYYYGVSIGFLAVEGILYAIMGTYPLLIVNTVLACIAIIVIIVARIKLGSNLE